MTFYQKNTLQRVLKIVVAVVVVVAVAFTVAKVVFLLAVKV